MPVNAWGRLAGNDLCAPHSDPINGFFNPSWSTRFADIPALAKAVDLVFLMCGLTLHSSVRMDLTGMDGASRSGATTQQGCGGRSTHGQTPTVRSSAAALTVSEDKRRTQTPGRGLGWAEQLFSSTDISRYCFAVHFWY